MCAKSAKPKPFDRPDRDGGTSAPKIMRRRGGSSVRLTGDFVFDDGRRLDLGSADDEEVEQLAQGVRQTISSSDPVGAWR